MSDERSYPSQPFVGVGAVVWKDNEVLLIQRGKEPSYGEWSLPAGTQELGETVIDTLHREVLEETGCHIGELKLLGIFDEIVPDETGKVRYHYTIIDYDAVWIEGTPKPGLEELDAKFYTLNQLSALQIWEKTLNAIHLSAERRGIISPT